jgi:Do/DeqQ family serine protease
MNTKKIFIVLIIAMAGGMISLSLDRLIFKHNAQYSGQLQTNDYAQKAVFVPNEADIDFSYAAEKTVNAVVHVKTTYAGNPQPTMYDFFFGNTQGMQQPIMASGSGVIISTDGYIVTNNHVVENATSIDVVLNDKRSFTAKLIGRDPSTDIALLKIDSKDLPTVSYGNSDGLKVGQWVLAVGNPFNLTSTVTAGIVSAKARNLNLLDQSYAIESFIQTDAAVNPGNSGGALVDTKGQLVGINTAIASQTGSYSGYSFAVPVTIVKKVVADLMEFGTVQRAMLGVSIRDIDADLAKEHNIDKMQGVYVAETTDGGTAKEAGIQSNDIITKINDIAVNKVSELQEQISKFRPGDKITITVLRNDKEKIFSAVLKNSMGTTGYVDKDAMQVLGATFSEISQDEKSKLGIDHGMKITEIGAGKLMKAGVQKGFIIVGINRQPVSSFQDIQNILNHTRGGVYIEGIYPDGTTGYYAFGLK